MDDKNTAFLAALAGLGDTPTPSTRDEAMLCAIIDRIADIESAIAGALPAVTSEDNGDVLTVVEGAWAKAAPSGGGGGFVITFTTSDWETATADKTFAELSAALTAGEAVTAYAVTDTGKTKQFIINDTSLEQGDASYVCFYLLEAWVWQTTAGLGDTTITYLGDGTINITQNDYELTPAT